MTLLTVSNQGFTVHNHTCGINFLSHLRGAPQNPRQTGMPWDAVGYQGRGRGRDPVIGTSGDPVIGKARPREFLTTKDTKERKGNPVTENPKTS